MSSHPEPSSKMTGKCCFVCSMNNYSVSRVKCRYLRMRKLVSLFEVQLFHRQMSTVRLAAMWDRRHPPPPPPVSAYLSSMLQLRQRLRELRLRHFLTTSITVSLLSSEMCRRSRTFRFRSCNGRKKKHTSVK